jgi:hypothetical protein
MFADRADAVSMLLLLVWTISGSWLLIAGVASGAAERRGLRKERPNPQRETKILPCKSFEKGL